MLYLAIPTVSPASPIQGIYAKINRITGSAHPSMTGPHTGDMAPSQTAIICLAVGLAVTVGANVAAPSYARIGVMLLFGAQIWLEQRFEPPIPDVAGWSVCRSRFCQTRFTSRFSCSTIINPAAPGFRSHLPTRGSPISAKVQSLRSAPPVWRPNFWRRLCLTVPSISQTPGPQGLR